MKIDIYSLKGTKVSQMDLPEDFQTKENLGLLTQAVHIYRERLHIGLAKTKTRGELGRSTRKIYKQKGTGGARHGSKSAPIFVGGGIVHGPQPVRRELLLPKKMADIALKVALGVKAKSSDLVTITGLDAVKKTGDLNKLVSALRSRGRGKITFVLSKPNLKVSNFLRNISRCEVVNFSDLNAYTIFFGGKVVFDEKVFEKTGKTKSIEAKPKKAEIKKISSKKSVKKQ